MQLRGQKELEYVHSVAHPATVRNMNSLDLENMATSEGFEMEKKREQSRRRPRAQYNLCNFLNTQSNMLKVFRQSCMYLHKHRKEELGSLESSTLSTLGWR